MSEADSPSRRRPPTVDLTAQEVASSSPDPKPPPDAEAAIADAKPEPAGEATSNTEPQPGGKPPGPFGRAARYAIGAALGAICVAAISAGLWFAGLLPVQNEPAPQSAGAAVHAEAPAGTSPVPAPQNARSTGADEISARLDRIEQALQGPPRTDAALAGRVAGAEAQGKALGDSLAALTRRVDDLAAAAQSALAEAKSAAAAADAAKEAAKEAAKTAASPPPSAVQRSDIEAIESRVAALQNAVKSLDTVLAQRASSINAADRTMRLAIAAEALRAAVDRGAPFVAELAAAKVLGADPKAVTTLEPFAAQGLTSTGDLGRELTALVPAIDRAVEPASNNASLLATLESRARKLVRITPVGTAAQPAGNDPAAVIARLNADAARGDIDGALAEIAQLPDEARALAQAWVDKAAARQAALADGRRIAAEALSALAKPESR
jgi:hypothetical protein